MVETTLGAVTEKAKGSQQASFSLRRLLGIVSICPLYFIGVFVVAMVIVVVTDVSRIFKRIR